MIGEPQTLDPMASTADLVGTIMLHVYEQLYTFDANWNVTPMLAESMPAISNGGLVYTIPLRKGVKFHNGQEMTSDDVLASLKRWMDTAPRGKALAKEVKSIEAKGPNAIVITLNRPYAPLLAHLALPNGFAAIMAKDSIATPLTQFVGTGPYMFKERKPDQYVQLVRFDGYGARSEPASGYAGKREALLDELRFIPVPNANTRVEGSLSGQYHFADVLPVESYARLESAANVKPVLTAPFGFPYLVLNTKQGPLANVALRQAVQASLNDADMLGAGFGDPKFYSADANHYAKNTPFYSTAGTEHYGKGDAKKAAALVAAAKYDGTPIKILTSQQYDFHYRIALVMAENLKAAGLQDRHAGGRLVDPDPAPQRPGAVGHLHHALGRPARADADAAAARRRRAGLVELAGEGRGAGGVQRRVRCQEARRPVGQHPVGRLHRGAVHPGRQLQQRDGALDQARRLRRDAVAVLLEHGPAEVR